MRLRGVMLYNKKSRRKVTQRRADRKPVAGVAWYSSTEWQRLREVAADPDRLEDTYQEWLAAVDQAWKSGDAAGRGNSTLAGPQCAAETHQSI